MTLTPKQRELSYLRPWIEARKRFHLSHAQIQMARELGMNPKKFGGLDNHDQEPWKMPFPQFIEHLYEKRFGRRTPDRVLSLEETAAERAAKRVAKRELRVARRASKAVASSSPDESPVTATPAATPSEPT